MRGMARGRPGKYNKALERKLCEHLATGGNFTSGAQLVGVHRRAVMQWVAKARAGDPKFAAILVAIGEEASPKLPTLHVLEQPKKRVRRTSGQKPTPQLTEELCTDILNGLSKTNACRKAGVGVDTLASWMRRGSQGEQPFADFAQAVDRADQTLKGRLVSYIEHSASRGDWKAAAWLLERRFRSEYGPKASDEPVRVADEPTDLSTLTREELGSLRDLLLKVS